MKLLTLSSSWRSSGTASSAVISAVSEASQPSAWSRGLSAFHRSQTLWLKSGPSASRSPSATWKAASVISAPLPRCERTSATVHLRFATSMGP